MNCTLDLDPEHRRLIHTIYKKTVQLTSRAVDPDNLIRIQDFDDQKLKNKNTAENLFLIKILQFTFVKATGEAFSPQKRTSST
jgi:hypothetical protein